MCGLSHATWLGESEIVEIRPREPTLSDVPQRGPWSRRRRTCWSNAQPERAILELHELPRENSRLAFTPGFLQVSYERTKKNHPQISQIFTKEYLCNLWMALLRLSCHGATTGFESRVEQL